jgi:hypothetical protein
VSHEEIARRAYQLWERRGCPSGSPEVDWFRAVYEYRAYQLFGEGETLRAVRERIARRAYQLWQQRGCPTGSPDIDWFQALHEGIERRAYEAWQERLCRTGSPDLDWLRAEDEIEWLTTLAPAQQSRIPKFIERWRAIAVSTAPTDRAAAESAIRRCYDRYAGNRRSYQAPIKPPERFIWLKSPLAGALAYSLRGNSTSLVWASMRESRSAAIEPHILNSIWVSVEQAVAAEDSAQPTDGGYGYDMRLEPDWDLESSFTWRSLEEGIPSQPIVDAVRGGVGGEPSLVDTPDHVVYGSLEAARVCAYSYLFDICGLKQCEIFDGLFEQARHCGWWWPLDGLVIATEKPVSLHVDDRGRLHHATEPAIAYGDGWGVHAWHGTRIPAKYYAQPVRAEQILKEENAEVRRALIERYGQDRFFLDAGAAVLDCDRKHRAELISINLPGDPERRMVALKLRCPSTSAVYIIRVPPHCTKAREALAWSYGLWDAGQYVLAGES